MVDLIEQINNESPLVIDHASFKSENLSLYGDNWSFNTTSAWRILTDEVICLGCFDNDAEDEIGELLIGKTIVSCRFSNDQKRLDLKLLLNTDEVIEVFSTFAYENWVLEVGERIICE